MTVYMTLCGTHPSTMKNRACRHGFTCRTRAEHHADTTAEQKAEQESLAAANKRGYLEEWLEGEEVYLSLCYETNTEGLKLELDPGVATDKGGVVSIQPASSHLPLPLYVETHISPEQCHAKWPDKKAEGRLNRVGAPNMADFRTYEWNVVVQKVAAQDAE
jgi:hypothetical protein